MTKTTMKSKEEQTTTQMPCRGCLTSCIFISKCEGKPWRMTAPTIAICLKQAKSSKLIDS